MAMGVPEEGGRALNGRVLRVLLGAEDNLQGGEGSHIAWVIGLSHSKLTLLSFLRCIHWDDVEPDFVAEADELRVLLPRGLEVLGAVVFSKEGGDSFRAGEAALKLREKLHLSTGKLDGVVTAAPVAGTTFKLQYNWYEPGIKSSSQVLEVQEFQEEAWTDTTFLRCQIQLSMPLYLSPTATASEYEEHAVGAINNILEELKSMKTVFLAEGPEGTVLLPSSCKESSLQSNADSQGSPLCSRLCSSQLLSTPGMHQLPAPVKLTVMSCSSGKKNTALLMQNLLVRDSVAVQLLKLDVDVLCLAPSQMPGVEAVTFLVTPALCDQLGAMSKIVKKTASQNPKISAFHFCPLNYPITAIYDLSYGETEIALVKSRRSLHQRLGLPFDRPLLRVANALMTMESRSNFTGSRRLCDVHIGLASSGVLGGIQSLVEGSYEYYHYLQDRMDDNGWGCAYRSLQTIISWFRLQHYTSVPVPTHRCHSILERTHYANKTLLREIQETLVEIGDKEVSFIGSQEWIGAIELSYVLDKLLGVSCKVLNVRSGAELPSKCRQLALHFSTQGTPIMIGGGVLAYTLLGVDYNEMTGECAFLILDPHYTGGEDLKNIRSGGWCGWKRAVGVNGKEFFLANRFYNLLMPQRPNTV